MPQLAPLIEGNGLLGENDMDNVGSEFHGDRSIVRLIKLGPIHLQKYIRNNDAMVRIDGYFRTNSGQSARGTVHQGLILGGRCTETILAHFAGEKINHRNYYPPIAIGVLEWSDEGNRPVYDRWKSFRQVR
jgi:hypothetical protein